MEKDKNAVSTIPNALTLLRIFAAVGVLWLLVHAQGDSLFLLAAFFIGALAAITDYFDGVLARRLGQESDLGKFLDPIADKALVYSVLFPLSLTYSLVPIWLIIILIIRDLLVVALSKAISIVGNEFNVTFFAKWKTTMQDLFILSGIIILLLNSVFFNPVPDFVMKIWNGAVWFIGILTILTLFHYIWVNRKSVKEFL